MANKPNFCKVSAFDIASFGVDITKSPATPQAWDGIAELLRLTDKDIRN